MTVTVSIPLWLACGGTGFVLGGLAMYALAMWCIHRERAQ